MEISRKICKEISGKSIICLILLLCADSSYSVGIPFYIVTSAVLNSSEISSNIFFPCLTSAIEDAITNSSKIFSKNFTIYLSNTDTSQTYSNLINDEMLPDSENTLDITVIPLPCKTNDDALKPYLSYCTEKRPKVIFINDDDLKITIYIGVTSNITMIGFDIISNINTFILFKFKFYCGVKDCEGKSPRITFENISMRSSGIKIENILEKANIILNVEMHDIQINW